MHNLLLEQANDLLNGGNFTWAFCGGYAIDLFLGYTTRKHSDIDICVIEDDRERIIEYMLESGWNVYQFLGGGKVRRLRSGDMSDSGRNLMCVKDDSTLVSFYPCEGNDILWYEFHHTGIKRLDYIEFLFNQIHENAFIINSKQKITRVLEKAILSDGLYPYLAPEIALLYKASNADNPEYQQDYALASPYLEQEQASWLQEGLNFLYPQGHLWLTDKH